MSQDAVLHPRSDVPSFGAVGRPAPTGPGSTGSPQPIDTDGRSHPPIDEVEAIFLKIKQRYNKLAGYLAGRRDELVRVAEEKRVSSRVSEASLNQIQPDHRLVIARLLAQENDVAINIMNDIHMWDSQVDLERQDIANWLRYLYTEAKPTYTALIKDLQSPTTSVCIELQLPPDEMAYSTLQPAPMDITSDNKELDLLMQELARQRQQIAALEARLAQQDAQPKDQQRPARGDQGEHKQDDFCERRRRTKIPTFSNGTVTEAQQWMDHYDRVSKYLGFSDEEKIEELHALMYGAASDWLGGLTPDIRKDWQPIRSNFLYHFGGGARPFRAALAELKQYFQGNKPIREFGPKIKELMHRAQIYSDDLQLD